MEPLLTSVAATGFGVAFFHAAVPTHWLPFALAGRVQCWSRPKTLAITAMAGGAHIVATMVLGLLIVWAGAALHEHLDPWFPGLAGTAIILCGLFYCYRQAAGHQCRLPGDEEGEDPSAPPTQMVAISGLFALLFFSPCEAFLPVYLSAAQYGWTGFLVLSATLAGATLLGMILFTWLTIVGMERVHLRVLEKYERGLTGALLCVIGAFIIFGSH